jgi:hypothetical protein
LRLKGVQLFQADSPDNDEWVGIIGVAGDVRNNGLREGALPAAYTPYTILTSDGARFVIRSAGAQDAIVHAASQQIAAIDCNQPISLTSTLGERLKAVGRARQEFVASLFLPGAGLALLLAAGGLYSVWIARFPKGRPSSRSGAHWELRAQTFSRPFSARPAHR